MKLTNETATKLCKELNALYRGVARIEGGYDGLTLTVRALMEHPPTGNSAVWLSRFEDGEPTAEEIIQNLKKELGIAAKRTRAAIKREWDAT